MKSRNGIRYVLFVVCLVAAMPTAWGEGRVGDLTREAYAILSEEVTLCHVPPGNPAGARTIVVRESWGAFAVRAHLAHGDYLGECHPACVGVPSPVPRTGQASCWSSNPYDMSPVDCAGTGQDGEHQKGTSVSPRFTDNGDGTVTDNLTGLVWLKNANCFGLRDWATSLSDANTLASGACGLTDGSQADDWRLPNVKELQSLLDYGRDGPALPLGHPFSGDPNYLYWSSTPYPGYGGIAWFVSLSLGQVQRAASSENYRVWPVRSGQ